jgi:hypothetical protein
MSLSAGSLLPHFTHRNAMLPKKVARVTPCCCRSRAKGKSVILPRVQVRRRKGPCPIASLTVRERHQDSVSIGARWPFGPSWQGSAGRGGRCPDTCRATCRDAGCPLSQVTDFIGRSGRI